MKRFLNPDEDQNCISGSKITVILLSGLTLRGGVALGSAPKACSAGLFLQ